MTCIIGYVADDGRVLVGGDSVAAAYPDVSTIANKKVFRFQNMLIGYTSSFRMGQLLEFGLTMPEYAEPQTPYEYMVKTFVPEVRRVLKDGGFTTVNNNTEDGGQFIVGFASCIFEVQNDFAVIRYRERFCAVGCGYAFAMGALRLMNEFSDIHRDDEKKILAALEIAGHFSTVRPPYYVLEAKS